MRAYTVSEIDTMRAAIRGKMIREGTIGTQLSNILSGYSILNENGVDIAENLLRTYMQGGVDPAELIASYEAENVNAS